MIRIDNLSKSFGPKIILNQVTYHFPEKERIALVGANGQGKTTLLNIISGLETSYGGQVIQPKAMRLAVLAQTPKSIPEPTLLEECMSGRQEVYAAKKQMATILEKMATDFQEKDYNLYEKLLCEFENSDGYQLEGTAEKILMGLGFLPAQLTQSPMILSGGWRMRLELAKTLISKPDFLILDEPTNHLDLPSIEWLEQYLQNFPGTLLFVSHDRAFLNTVSTITLYLKNGTLQPFRGNFEAFLAQKEQLQKTEDNTLKRVLKKQAHMQRFVDRFRAKASKVGQVNSRKKAIDKLQEVIKGLPVEESEAKIHIPSLPFTNSGKDVFSLKNLSIGYTNPLLKSITYTVQRGQRIAIVGTNGIGKSTLLKTLYGMIPPLAGSVIQGQNVQIGFYTQNAADDMPKQQTVFEAVRNLNPQLSEQMLRALLGMMLFKGPDLAKLVSVLSGGERSRLAICGLLAQTPNCLLLDEPTNHLDLVSAQILANMLQEYKGTVIFVSHDRDFIEQAATQILEIDGQGKICY